MTEDGRLISVSRTTLGTTLAADASMGDGSVTLTDTSDFDEDGGSLQLAGSVYVYTTLDPDSGLTVLGSTLIVGVSEGDRVDVWDTGLAAVAVDGRALVALPGGLANDEPVDADIAHNLLPFLADGLRVPGTEEAVVMERRGDSWTVIDVRGKQPIIQPEFAPAAAVITAWGFFDGTSATTFTGPEVDVIFVDNGSDPGIWQANATLGIDAMVNGVYESHLNVFIDGCDPGDEFTTFLAGGGELGRYAATFTADGNGEARAGGAAAIMLVSTAPEQPRWTARLSQISGTGTAPNLRHFDVQLNKLAS